MCFYYINKYIKCNKNTFLTTYPFHIHYHSSLETINYIKEISNYKGTNVDKLTHKPLTNLTNTLFTVETQMGKPTFIGFILALYFLEMSRLQHPLALWINHSSIHGTWTTTFPFLAKETLSLRCEKVNRRMAPLRK